MGGIVMPGTLRDSLGILDTVFNLDTPQRPQVVITDTGSVSDMVFGLFAICGYQLSPRIADISDARLWRFDLTADYGPLQPVSRHRVQTEKIRQHWEDMLRVAGSLTTGTVRAHDLLRVMTSGERMTGLGDAFAHDGRIFKTLHLLQFIDSEAYRRMIGVQLNIGEGRHALARRIFFGRLGELRHGYRDGMEDQLGALGLALNAVVFWNTLYIDAALRELEAGGLAVPPEIRSRLSPLVHEHINLHGRYPIVRSGLGIRYGRCATRTGKANRAEHQMSAGRRGIMSSWTMRRSARTGSACWTRTRSRTCSTTMTTNGSSGEVKPWGLTRAAGRPTDTAGDGPRPRDRALPLQTGEVSSLFQSRPGRGYQNGGSGARSLGSLLTGAGGRTGLAEAHGSSGAVSRAGAPGRVVRVMATVAKVIEAPTSSTSITIPERFSPSGVSHRSVRSLPATTTRAPLDSDSARFSASCLQALQSRNVGSPSRQVLLSRSKLRGVEATVNRATGTPAGVNRNSGSSTRFPITVSGRSLRIPTASHAPVTTRPVRDLGLPRLGRLTSHAQSRPSTVPGTYPVRGRRRRGSGRSGTMARCAKTKTHSCWSGCGRCGRPAAARSRWRGRWGCAQEERNCCCGELPRRSRQWSRVGGPWSAAG